MPEMRSQDVPTGVLEGSQERARVRWDPGQNQIHPAEEHNRKRSDERLLAAGGVHQLHDGSEEGQDKAAHGQPPASGLFAKAQGSRTRSVDRAALLAAELPKAQGKQDVLRLEDESYSLERRMAISARE